MIRKFNPDEIEVFLFPASGLFTIGSSSGALSITSAPNFDILQVPYYLLEVTASDNGGLAGFCQSTVTVGVTVNNKNDNAPGDFFCKFKKIPIECSSSTVPTF